MSALDPSAARDQLAAALAATRWGDVRWVAETGSTNADLAAVARRGRSSPVVLVADHQTGGRGRLDRRWDSPPGANVLVSILLQPVGEPARWTWVSAALAVAAVDACAAAGVEARIKWPNDLVVGSAKVAGLLAEIVADSLVIGIGINVAWPSGQDAERGATSLHAEGSTVDRVDLLADVLVGFDARLDQLGVDGATIRSAYRRRGATAGQRVRVELVGGDVVEGRAVDIDDDGALVVDTDDGPVVITVGDVFHLRPSS